MQISIITDCPEFTNDIGDVIRLFFGEGAAVEAGAEADMTITHVEKYEASSVSEVVRLTGNGIDRSTSLEGKRNTSQVLEKRIRKRLIKRCCFSLLEAYTGHGFPWGSLTGIRPSRLYRQLMESGMTREEARNSLLQDFSVSQGRISLLDEILDTQGNDIYQPQDQYDLYIGVPFCTTRCSYCSFSSGLIGNGRLTEPYLAALLEELAGCKRLLDEHNLRIGNVYFGGGTPTSLSASQLERLLNAVSQLGSFHEWTVEAGRPDTIDLEKLQVMKQFPVTRISINPQSMNDETLVRIGRAHTAEEIRKSYNLARSLGYDDINMDVIVALPGEDLPMFQHTMSEIEQMQPDSLTVHTLAIKHSSKLHELHYEQAQEDMYLAMADLGRETAHRMGMKAYYLYRQKYMASNLENVGYSLPQKICQYNIDNMEETSNVLALGAGGISKRLMGKDMRILRAPNVSNIETYIARVDDMIRRKAEMLNNVQ